MRRSPALALLLCGCVAPAPPPAPPPAPAPASVAPAPRPAVPVAAAPTVRLEGVPQQGALLAGTVRPGAVSLALDGVPVPLADDGHFILGFDRDAPAAMTLVERRGGSVATLALTVAPRAWSIQRLDRLAKIPLPSAEFTARRPAELTQIAAARARDTGAQGWRQRVVWPATGRISGVFGSQRIYRGEPGAYHAGVDIARPAGTTVVAPADGTVVLAATSPFTLEGNLLIIDHGMGLNSAFLHLSRIDVAPGDHVRQGQPVGAIGATGRATGPHLHWAMMWGKARIDPQRAAGEMRPIP